jgi:Domain of unknown function (DUF309)
MRRALPLGLRNQLAELILEAFDHDEARHTLAAVAAFCEDDELEPAALARLGRLGWFERAGTGRLRLLGAHAGHHDALCRRATAGLGAVCRAAPDGRSVAGLLARAAVLADARLYFEVHELLEPAWMRAEGGERLALQGLIQIAVALHHAEHGNREGAVSLLTEGLAKLDAAGAALPLGTGGWARRLGEVLAAWRSRAPAPLLLPWPTPTEAAWRSS